MITQQRRELAEKGASHLAFVKSNKLVVIGGSLLALVVLALVIGQISRSATTPSTAPSGTMIQQAGRECGVASAVKDAGHTITLRTGGGHTIADVSCVLSKLGASDATFDHLNSTRALDGQQVEEWGMLPSLKARWTYHPDSGLTLTITQ